MLPACIDVGAPLELWALTALCLVVRVNGALSVVLHHTPLHESEAATVMQYKKQQHIQDAKT